MTERARFKNSTAGFIWGFATIWLTMLVTMSYLMYRDGPPEGYSIPATLAILLFFWVGGAALAVFAASKACFLVTVLNSKSVQVVRRYPFKVERRTIDKDHLNPAKVVSEKDSDGDPHYYARVKTADGVCFDLTESHDYATCDQVCTQFNQAIFSDCAGV
jgi:hypothetical protein